MNIEIARPFRSEIVYPETDGLPMSDNTKQFRWIVVLFGNIAAIFRDRKDVFVSGNQNWYPVEGHPEICQAPDVYAVFGRPKGDRPSYKQWEEDGVPMTVVFEVFSPSNDHFEMADKQNFYEEYGVEEYYLYDPEKNRLHVYVRNGDILRRIRPVHDFVSPRLGIRFDQSGPELVVLGPTGSPFLSFEDLALAREQSERALVEADEARKQADEARKQADEARKQADEARIQAELSRERTERLAERLVALGRKARQGQASAEDLQELDRLEQELHRERQPGGQ